jgi:hypothetical protein
VFTPIRFKRGFRKPIFSPCYSSRHNRFEEGYAKPKHMWTLKSAVSFPDARMESFSLDCQRLQEPAPVA